MTAPRSFSWDVTSIDHPEAEEEYRDSFRGLYEIAEMDLGSRGIFFNRTRMTLFSGGVIGHGRCNTQTLRRCARNVRRGGFESLSLVLANSPMAGSAGRRSLACAPGSIIFLDLSQPSASHWRDLDLINLVVPREMTSRWLAGADLHGVTLGPDSSAGRLIASHLRTLSEVAPGLSDAEGHAAIGAALMIAERALGGAPAADGNLAAALYRTVRQSASRFLETRLLSPGLTAERIARACAVSRATLYRAFGGQGGLMRHIQRRRLELARDALERRIGSRPTVADIAHRHGFASPAHFSRAFRTAFGCSPSEVAPATAGDGRSAQTNVIRHRAVVDWLSTAAEPG